MMTNNPNPIATHLGRYQIIEQIGDGAMAVVYSALDPSLNRTVAIKVIREELSVNDEYIARFQREAESAAKLSHPNIVTVYDVGIVEHRPYIVMELLKGQTMQAIIDSHRMFSTKETLDIGIDLALALSYAHDHHMVHRDIKPANIICTEANGKYTAKIADFGIVRLTNEGMTEYTIAGSLIGSPSNMSPEQVKGLPVDGRSDLFSLGITLYQMLTGKRPFGNEGHTTLYAIAEQPHRPIIELLPQINPKLLTVINKLLEKNPKHRYLSGKTMADDLRIIRSDKFSDAGNDRPITNSASDTVIKQREPFQRSADAKKSPRINDYRLPLYSFGLFLIIWSVLVITVMLSLKPLSAILNQQNEDRSTMLVDILARQYAEPLLLQDNLVVKANVQAFGKQNKAFRTLSIIDWTGVIRGDIDSNKLNKQVDVMDLPKNNVITYEPSKRPLTVFGIGVPIGFQQIFMLNKDIVVNAPILYANRTVGYIRLSLFDSSNVFLKYLLGIVSVIAGILLLLSTSLFYFFGWSFIQRQSYK